MKCLKCNAKLQEATIYLSNNDIGLKVKVPVECIECKEITWLTVEILRQECVGAVRDVLTTPRGAVDPYRVGDPL
jgi:hypothetical protein